MKKHLSFLMILLGTFALAACGANSQNSNSVRSTTSKGPVKTVTDLSISLRNGDDDKAYIRVTGKQSNYTAEDFKWAWGLKGDDGTFDDGKQIPASTDFQTVAFNSNNGFTVDYCLTDIANLRAGTLYRIYGGTPETYNDIPFANNQFGASDATRKYYLRQDQNNSLVFEYIQPITYTKASVVEITQDDLPDGVTAAGAYLKFGGANSKNLTMETINGWHAAGKIAGDFQRVIPEDSYSIHNHADTERFWAIEGSEVYFYLYVGFISEGEGWMVHFDVVGGATNAGLQTSTTINGASYTVGTAMYKVYSDRNASGESNYWGCVGVYRPASA